MFPDVFMEQRYKIQQSMEMSISVIESEAENWFRLTDRRLKPIYSYQVEDAEIVTLCLGTAYGAFCNAVDELRSEGHKVGALRMWQYRPFPRQA